MTDSKDRKTTITLEPRQVAIVLGMEDGQISRQLFTGPKTDAVLMTINRTFNFTAF